MIFPREPIEGPLSDRTRRGFIGVIGALQFAPFVLAQPGPSKRVYRVGLLTLAHQDSHGFVEILRKEPGRAGFVEGVNLSFDIQALHSDPAKLPAAAQALVAAQPDLIITDGGSAVATVAKNATSTIPIVHAGCRSGGSRLRRERGPSGWQHYGQRDLLR